MPERPLGRVPSPADPRDFDIRSLINVAAIAPALPTRFRVFSATRIGRFDQQENSCVGQSSAFVKIIQERRDMRRHYPIEPLWIWDRAKELDGIGDPTADRGTYIRTALQLLVDEGAAIHRDGDADPRFKLSAYFRCHTVTDVKAAMYAVGPVLFGSDWFDSWFEPGDGGMLPKPDTNVGGHATAGYGWNDLIEVPWDGSMGAFRVANSWGEEYGDDGDFWMPYSMFGEGKPLDEAWKPVDLIT